MQTQTAIPLGFSDGLAAQNIPLHIASIESFGYRPRDLTANKAKLRDLYCPETDTYFECKTERQKPINHCIELIGNLPELPKTIEANRKIYPDSIAYPFALDYLRQTYQSRADKLSLGFSSALETRHLVSFLFETGETFLYDVRRLQTEIVFPSLKEQRFPLLWSASWECGSQWFSLSVLIPVATAKTVALSRPAPSPSNQTLNAWAELRSELS